MERLPHIIVTGAAGHGKDTIGNHLIARHGYVRMSFSDYLRDEVAPAYAAAPDPVTPAWLDLREIKNLPQERLALGYCNNAEFVAIAFAATVAEDAQVGVTVTEARLAMARSPRRIQQLWGTEYRRRQTPDYWVDCARRHLDLARPHVMCSGRFRNEIDFFYAIGGARWHVVRPGHQEIGAIAAATHQSEDIAPPDPYTIVLINDGSIADLERRTSAALAAQCGATPGLAAAAHRRPQSSCTL